MVRSIVLAALAARAAAMSWSLPAALVDDDAHAVFGDGLTIHVHLEADERAALIYVDGALALELPDKRWALLSEPPCEEGTAPRWTSGVLPVERNGDVEETSSRTASPERDRRPPRGVEESDSPEPAADRHLQRVFTTCQTAHAGNSGRSEQFSVR